MPRQYAVLTRQFFELLREQRAQIQNAAIRLRREGGDDQEIRQLDFLQLRLKEIYYQAGGEPYDPTQYWQ